MDLSPHFIQFSRVLSVWIGPCVGEHSRRLTSWEELGFSLEKAAVVPPFTDSAHGAVCLMTLDLAWRGS